MNSIKRKLTNTLLLAYAIAVVFFQAAFGFTMAMAADFPADDALIPENIEIQASFEIGAGEPIGSIEVIVGEGLVIHQNKDKGYLLKVNDPLYPDDTLITRENSRLQFGLNDGSQIIMNPLTKMTLDLNLYDPESRQRHSLIRMAQGKARYVVKKLIDFKQSRFQVWTRTFIVGTRDSDFVIEATAATSIVTALQDTVLDILSIIAIDAPPTVVSEYHRTLVEKGQMPAEPYRVPADEIDALIREMTIVKDSAKEQQGESGKGGMVGGGYATGAGQDAVTQGGMIIDKIIELPMSTRVIDTPDDAVYYNLVEPSQSGDSGSASIQPQDISQTQMIQNVQEDIYEDINQDIFDPDTELFQLPGPPNE